MFLAYLSDSAAEVWSKGYTSSERWNLENTPQDFGHNVPLSAARSGIFLSNRIEFYN